MNPKKEFVNAIMSVLRLEQNIYVTASIEEVIERLEVKDYTRFISYLGERKSDYEKPIESIAKGVNEFYELKLIPHKQKAYRMIYKIETANDKMRDEVAKTIQISQVEKDNMQKIAIDGYQKQGEDRVKECYSMLYSQLKDKKKYKTYKQNLLRSPKDTFFRELKDENTGERIYPDKILDVMIFIDSMKPIREKVYEYYLRDKILPSIEEKIVLEESGEDFSISPQVKALLPKINYTW